MLVLTKPLLVNLNTMVSRQVRMFLVGRDCYSSLPQKFLGLGIRIQQDSLYKMLNFQQKIYLRDIVYKWH